MLASTILQSISALFVLLTIIGFGVWLSRKRYFDSPSSRATVSKLVNTSIPCFLFYSVISKFSHDELLNLLTFAGVPFLTVAINYFISLLFIRLGKTSFERDFYRGFFGGNRFICRCSFGVDDVWFRRYSVLIGVLLCQLRVYLDGWSF